MKCLDDISGVWLEVTSERMTTSSSYTHYLPRNLRKGLWKTENNMDTSIKFLIIIIILRV